MAEYYVIGADGERYGPADVQTLNQWAIQGRVKGDSTLVDAETDARISAWELPGFQVPPKAPPITQPAQRASQWQMSQGQAPHYVHVENNLAKAIFSTICCCLPVGVVAIVYASQVEGHSRRGDVGAAQDAADKANTWANWSFGLGAAYVILYLLFVLSTGQTPSGRRFR